MVSPLFMAIYAQTQNPELQNVREQKFMEAAIQARERAYELRDLGIEKIGNIPDEIEDLLNEADILLAEGNIQKAIEAMNKYRNAYRYLYCYLEQHGVDIETTETARGIIVAINRTYTRIERLNNTINVINSTLDKTDSNYDQVKVYLEWGWGNLTEAADNLNLANYSLNLESPNIIWVTNNLTESNRNIQEAHTALKLIACWTNQWRIRNFLGEQNRTRERIRKRIQQGGFDLGVILEKLGYTSLEDFEQTIDVLMENAQQRMEIREAVQELWTIREKLREMDLELQNGQHGWGV
jgi:tetratricopeptide (TPR) repeat protein